MKQSLHVKDDNKLFLRKFSAMAIGNIMEWFDFSSFGALVDIIGDVVFPPQESSSMKLIKALGIFGAAFVMRPLGGIFMGWIGDTYGRKRALEISILLMLFPSFLIGCLPGFETIGWFSATILMVLRLLQGLAAGGELVGAYLYTLEATNGINMGFWGGACKATGNFGTTLGLGLVALLRNTLTAKEMHSWGWRIPFLLGLLFGISGIYLRNSLGKEANGEGTEFEILQKNNSTQKSPTTLVLLYYWRELLTVTFVASFWGACFYTSFIWLPYFMQSESLIGSKTIENAWTINFAANFVLVLVMPIGGIFGDFLGRLVDNKDKGFILAMEIGILLMVIAVIPAFILIKMKLTLFAVLGQSLLILPVAIFGANLPAFMISMFDVSLRYSGVGISYNLAHALFSSTTSIIQTSLILYGLNSSQFNNSKFELDDNRLRPAYYLIVICLLSFVSLTLGVDYCKAKRAYSNNLSRKDYASMNMVSNPLE